MWGVASVFVAVFGTLLSIIACHPYRRHADTGAVYVPTADYSTAPGFAALDRSGPAPPMVRLAAWLPDPTGRHELRYFDGSEWTEHVSSGGAISVDGL